MNESDIRPHPLAEILESYLLGLEDQGVQTLLLEHPFPSAAVAAKPPRPRQQPAPVPPVDPPVEKPILPPGPQPEPVTVPAADKPVWCTLVRLEECGDSLDSSETMVVLVTVEEEMNGENGRLLKQILHAAGYSFHSKPLPLAHGEDLKGGGARILVMGNPALQKVSPAGMDLRIVRGMWQSTAYGKLIPTFPPSVLPDNPAGKKAVWQDLKKLLSDLNLEVPDWTRKKLSTK